MKFLITGGAGFIGSAVIRLLIEETPHKVLNLDKLTYAGNLGSLANVLKILAISLYTAMSVIEDWLRVCLRISSQMW